MKKKFCLVLFILMFTQGILAQNSSPEPISSPDYEKLENSLRQIFRPDGDAHLNDDALRELRNIDSPESAKKLSSDSIMLLEQLEKSECLSLLHNCVLNTQSFFTPFEPSDKDKHFNLARDFRNFRGCCIALGWRKDSLGETKEACQIFCDLVRLGSLFSQKAFPLATVGGAGICQGGLNQLGIFMTHHSEPIWKKFIQTALEKLPRPVINFKGLLVNEQKRIQYALEFTRQNLDSWRARKDIPWLGPTASPEQKCAAYQTILLIAMIVRQTDYNYDPQSKPISLEKGRELILRETALEAWPVCPEGGSYEIPENLSYDSICSVHSLKIPLPEGAVRDENFSFGVMPLELLPIVDTPEFEIQATQALNLMDSLLKLSTLEPDCASKTSELFQQYANSGPQKKPNLIVKSLLTTDYSKVIKIVQEAQEKIDALMQ